MLLEVGHRYLQFGKRKHNYYISDASRLMRSVYDSYLKNSKFQQLGLIQGNLQHRRKYKVRLTPYCSIAIISSLMRPEFRMLILIINYIKQKSLLEAENRSACHEIPLILWNHSMV
jgi:hypothetical protein